MPPAVLADSDDDGDDSAEFECEDTMASSRGSRAGAAEGDNGGLDGADERSTGSTDKLRRQIQSAERGLFTNSAPGMDQHAASSASPLTKATKRRHTAAFASEGDASPAKSVKRSKTLKTYGGGRRQIEVAEDSNFDQFRKEDGPPATASQLARFSEHSGQHSSMPLPAGSIQTDFLNHEPAVMFKDTGDTVAEASSEQQRLLDQALASNRHANTSLTKDVQHPAEQQSSSIPWTASDIGDSAKSKKSQSGTKEGGEAEIAKDANEVNGYDNSAAHRSEKDVEEESQNHHEGMHFEVSQPDKSVSQNDDLDHRPNASPIVEIPLQRSRKASNTDGESEGKGRAARPSKRKVKEDDSEPLNSDDRAIGLPKERYQPRPSRRRATQVIEEPIDYSVIPEKASKIKRNKTAGARSSIESGRDGVDAAAIQKTGVSPPGPSKNGLSGDARRDTKSPERQDEDAPDGGQDESPVKPKQTMKQTEIAAQPEDTKANEEPSATPDESKDAKQADDDKIFVKPALPTPKPKAASKARRSHTTIFEDHVEFVGSRRSPNLSQQQAKRKSALQGVKNEAAPASQRKRKTVVAEDSDDEDELAKENDAVAEKEDPPPKKRRGRPPKVDKQVQQKATDTVSKDSADEDDEDPAEPEAEQSEVEEPPKKRGRGRPAKAAGKANSAEEKETTDQQESSKADVEPNEPAQNDNKAPLQSTLSKPSAPAGTMPTPSPEQPAEKTKATPQKASAPTQHSPIKSSSKVPFRVGLSKKSRIPSLLKVNRPPKR